MKKPRPPKVIAIGATEHPCADGCGRIRQPGFLYCTTCRNRRCDASRKKKPKMSEESLRAALQDMVAYPVDDAMLEQLSRMAWKGDYEVTDNDKRALAMLVTIPELVGPGNFGECFWGKPTLSNGYRGSNCSAPYARSAGKVFNRLRDQGLAEWVRTDNSWGWRATPKGYKAVGGINGRELRSNR